MRSRKTGTGLPLNAVLVGDSLKWLAWFGVVKIAALTAPRGGPTVWFTPDQPRPWYVIWAAAALAGVRIARSPGEADAVFRFEDATVAAPPPPGRRVLNGGCTDVSKSAVAAAFERVFGYPLAVDPATWRGPAVEKGEINGAHDGRVVLCPTPAVPGRTYSRLIDTVTDGAAIDLRVACVGGEPVLVYRKRKDPARRFAIDNVSVALRRPDQAFSPAELGGLTRLCAALHLDWASLDVLRDRADGRLYVVDVNPTDMGPPLALPLRDKLAATRALGAALRALIEGAGAPTARSVRASRPTPP